MRVMTDKERVGQLLRDFRTAAGVSQSGLAVLMTAHRWHQSTVAKAEAGLRAVRADEAVTIARALKAPLDWAAA
jgi:transcriptional regulator with XRE-family HTH domain